MLGATSSIAVDVGSWAALMGILLPPIVGLIQHEKWSPVIQGVVFGVVCVVASVVYSAIKFDPWNWADWRNTLLATIVWGVGTFMAYWRPSGIIDKARAVPLTGQTGTKAAAKR